MINHATFLQTLQASPMWEGFSGYYRKTHGYNIKVFLLICESFQLAALVDYFDSKGIYVCPLPFTLFGLKWKTSIGNVYIKGSSDSRPDAIRAGLIKAITLI